MFLLHTGRRDSTGARTISRHERSGEIEVPTLVPSLSFSHSGVPLSCFKVLSTKSHSGRKFVSAVCLPRRMNLTKCLDGMPAAKPAKLICHPVAVNSALTYFPSLLPRLVAHRKRLIHLSNCALRRSLGSTHASGIHDEPHGSLAYCLPLTPSSSMSLSVGSASLAISPTLVGRVRRSYHGTGAERDLSTTRPLYGLSRPSVVQCASRPVLTADTLSALHACVQPRLGVSLQLLWEKIR